MIPLILLLAAVAVVREDARKLRLNGDRHSVRRERGKVPSRRAIVRPSSLWRNGDGDAVVSRRASVGVTVARR